MIQLDFQILVKRLDGRWKKVALFLGGILCFLILLAPEILVAGGWLIWFWGIRAGLAWLDRLFYPYTALIIIGGPLLALVIVIAAAWFMSSAVAGESRENPGC